MRTYRNHDDYLDKALKDPKEAARYLNAVMEENDQTLVLVALSQVAKARGLSKTAKTASLSRMGLYKMLSKKGNPEFKTFINVLNAAGLRMSFKPIA